MKKMAGRLNENKRNDQTEVTFGLPIVEEAQNVTMKNISPLVLPLFHGISNEDPHSSLFEFDILGCIYNYVNDGTPTSSRHSFSIRSLFGWLE